MPGSGMSVRKKRSVEGGQTIFCPALDLRLMIISMVTFVIISFGDQIYI